MLAARGCDLGAGCAWWACRRQACRCRMERCARTNLFSQQAPCTPAQATSSTRRTARSERRVYNKDDLCSGDKSCTAWDLKVMSGFHVSGSLPACCTAFRFDSALTPAAARAGGLAWARTVVSAGTSACQGLGRAAGLRTAHQPAASFAKSANACPRCFVPLPLPRRTPLQTPPAPREPH